MPRIASVTADGPRLPRLPRLCDWRRAVAMARAYGALSCMSIQGDVSNSYARSAGSPAPAPESSYINSRKLLLVICDQRNVVHRPGQPAAKAGHRRSQEASHERTE